MVHVLEKLASGGQTEVPSNPAKVISSVAQVSQSEIDSLKSHVQPHMDQAIEAANKQSKKVEKMENKVSQGLFHLREIELDVISKLAADNLKAENIKSQLNNDEFNQQLETESLQRMEERIAIIEAKSKMNPATNEAHVPSPEDAETTTKPIPQPSHLEIEGQVDTAKAEEKEAQNLFAKVMKSRKF